MSQIKYNATTEELEIIFKKTKNPEIIKLKNGVMLAYGPKFLSSIILPKFFKSINLPKDENANFSLDGTELNNTILTLKIKMNQRTINLNIDLSELETFK